MPQMNGKVPSSLAELAKLVDSVDDGENSLNWQWLTWTYNFLTSRKAYHKKQQLKRKMMMKVASETLSADELQAIDDQVEKLAGGEE